MDCLSFSHGSPDMWERAKLDFQPTEQRVCPGPKFNNIVWPVHESHVIYFWIKQPRARNSSSLTRQRLWFFRPNKLLDFISIDYASPGPHHRGCVDKHTIIYEVLTGTLDTSDANGYPILLLSISSDS